MGTPGDLPVSTPLGNLSEYLTAALQLPHGLRVHVTDPQAFRAAFEALRAQAAPTYDNLYIRSAPLNAHEIWILKGTKDEPSN